MADSAYPRQAGGFTAPRGPPGAYGSDEEALLFECGPRAAYAYDELHAIEKRFMQAVPGTPWGFLQRGKPMPEPASFRGGLAVLRGYDVPPAVLDAARRGYSMHGAGLAANLIAAAWPEIVRYVREQTFQEAAAPPDTAALRDRLVEALHQHTLATGLPTSYPPDLPEDPWLEMARRADEARGDAMLPAVEAWASENFTAAASSAPATGPESAPAREVPAAPHDWCGASARIDVGPIPYMGPCVLRNRHDGPVHLDGNGATWTDPQPATAAASSALCPPALRDQLADTLRAAFRERIIAEWICCDPPQPGHDLCKQGHAALEMVSSLLDDGADDPFGRSKILDAMVSVVETAVASARSAATGSSLVAAEGEPDEHAAVRHMLADIIKHLEGRPAAIITNAVWARVRPALHESAAQVHEQQERADAVTHLLEHWADEHMTLKVLGGDEVHADWCYRCRLEGADTAEQEWAAAHAALVETNARMVELADWAARDLTGDTLHHVLFVITNVRDLVDPDRTLHQPEEDHE